LRFYFPATLEKPAWCQKVYVYITTIWEGKICESEEMAPKWFDISEIPYKSMWIDDPFWLPRVLEGKKVTASFLFTQDLRIAEQEILIDAS
jgi:hypothetical protein